MKLQELYLRIEGLLFLAIGLVGFALTDPAIGQESPVVSFEAAEASADIKTKQIAVNGEQQDEPLLSFNFRFAPWEDVLKTFAQRADLTLDLTEVPPGTFNYFDSGRYTPRQAIDILNGYLLRRGFALVRRDRFLVCVNSEKGIPANLIPLVTLEQLPDFGDNELVSVIFSQQNVNATQAVSQIEKLLGPHGKVTVMATTNSFVITDVGRSLRLVQRLLDRGTFSGPAVSSSGLSFKVFDMQYVHADEADKLIRALFQVPAANEAALGNVPRSSDPNLAVDVTTNRLFVTATTTHLTTIEQFIEAFDVPRGSEQSLLSGNSPAIRIVPLKNADVIIIGRALDALSPRIKVSTTQKTTRPEPAAQPRPIPASPPAAEAPKENVIKRAEGRDG